MPKLRISKTIAKRFKVTASGKIMRRHHGARHRMSHKSTAQIRHFSEPIQVTSSFKKEIKKALGF